MRLAVTPMGTPVEDNEEMLGEGLEEFGERFRERLRKLTPSIATLKKGLEELGAQDLSKEEEFQAMRHLEREWHIIRLMKLLQTYFKDKIEFGGGSVLNYVFLIGLDEAPRFTFDLDASWMRNVRVKRDLLAETIKFNMWLSSVGETLPIPITGDRFIRLYIVEYDIEKDHFPDVLSLKYPSILRWSGRKFYEYVGKAARTQMDYKFIAKLRRGFEEVLGVRNALIDDIRFEISFGSPMPYKSYRVSLPFGMGSVELNVTEIEYQLASKISRRLGRDFGVDLDNALHDLLKATLDLRLLELIDMNKVNAYVEQIAGKPLSELRNTIKRNLKAVLEKGTRYWNGQLYILVRKKRDLGEIVKEIEETLF